MKKLFFTLVYISALFVSCNKSEKFKPSGDAKLELYVAVIDGLSYTTTRPACFENNKTIDDAISLGAKNIKYAKVATETGKSCSMKAKINFTAGETPSTDKIDIMFIPAYNISSSSSYKPNIKTQSAEALFSKGLQSSAIASCISRRTGYETYCIIEM